MTHDDFRYVYGFPPLVVVIAAVVVVLKYLKSGLVLSTNQLMIHFSVGPTFMVCEKGSLPLVIEEMH